MSKIIQRTFMVGDKWLYFKIYAGPHTCECILSEIILPLSDTLLAENIIDKWFFIRFADPHPHLRVRFLLKNCSDTGYVIEKLNRRLSERLRDDLIWKIQVDTYHQEIERYGANSIEFVEELFYHDSKMIAALAGLLEMYEAEQVRWLFGIRSIDSFLDVFNLNLNQKLSLLGGLSEGFKQEFGGTKSLKIQLDGLYRHERKKIEEFMQPAERIASEIIPLLNLLNSKSEAIRPVILQLLTMFKTKELQVDINALLQSLIHMQMNRLFKSSHRLNEMVCYDFLHRYYKSCTARLVKEKQLSEITNVPT